MAQYAGRASAQLHTVILFRGTVRYEDAYVTRVRQNGFMAFVPKYALEYVCMATDKDGNPIPGLVLDEENQTLSLSAEAAASGGKAHWKPFSVRVLDKVRVRISVDTHDPHEQHLLVQCVSPPIHLPCIPPGEFDLGDVVLTVDAKQQEREGAREKNEAELLAPRPVAKGKQSFVMVPVEAPAAAAPAAASAKPQKNLERPCKRVKKEKK